MIKQKLGLDSAVSSSDGSRKDPLKLVSMVFWYQYKLGGSAVVGWAEEQNKKGA